MNIFKILSSGDGSIKEPNISAFFGYLLDPNKEHGLKDYLLAKIISPLVSSDNGFKDIQINDNVVNLTNDSNFRVIVELEKKVKDSKKQEKHIDIVIFIFNVSDLQIPLCIICIENKIQNGAIVSNQLKSQFEGISNDYPNIPIGFIYLTPFKNDKSVQEYNDFQQLPQDTPSYHLFWKDSNSNDENDDVHALLVKMLEDETKGYIEPIFEYSKYTIKAFLNFINSGFKSYVEEKSLINKKMKYKRVFREYIQEIHAILDDNKEYAIADIKLIVENLILKENPDLSVNKGTLNAQIYMSIVNEKNRLHYGVKTTNHEQYDLFYYLDQTKKFAKKYNKNLRGIEVLYNL